MPRRKEYKYDVFVSHSSRDKQWVRRFTEDLKHVGLKAWFDDEQIHCGDSISGTIRNALENSRIVVVLVTEASAKSDWVMIETAQALLGTELFPVMLEEVETRYPAKFNDLKWISLACPEP